MDQLQKIFSFSFRTDPPGSQFTDLSAQVDTVDVASGMVFLFKDIHHQFRVPFFQVPGGSQAGDPSSKYHSFFHFYSFITSKEYSICSNGISCMYPWPRLKTKPFSPCIL